MAPIAASFDLAHDWYNRRVSNVTGKQETNMKNWIALGSFLIVVSAVTAFGQQKELRISAIPDENPQELLRIYTPFADYLSKEVGMPVKFTPVVDYPATVEGLSAGKLDMVWYGGLTPGQAARVGKGAKRGVMREEETQVKRQLITR